MDNAKVWKTLGQKPSGFFQELKATTLAKYFRAI